MYPIQLIYLETYKDKNLFLSTYREIVNIKFNKSLILLEGNTEYIPLNWDNLTLRDNKLDVSDKHSTGLYSWETKNFEFWTILQSLLSMCKPKTMVEIGSGKSTFYLNEYADKHDADIISIEQHPYYANKANLGLSLLSSKSGTVKYVPLDGDWYDADKFNTYIDSYDEIDFLFLDGPATPGGGKRDSIKFYDLLFSKLLNAKLIIVDDVHRDLDNDLANHLAKTIGLSRYTCDDYKTSNVDKIAILVNSEMNDKLLTLPSYLLERINYEIN